ncbi:hypothetical protein [Prosthecobacter fluviatilis]|uniref:Uncharacterized protein n=1 Tax=Prosthecobacter fluviatilis TaxID=445931 RepID=A0ABW0KUW1_9BACT
MKLPLDPSHFDMPLSLATCIFGAAVSALGLVAATVAGWYLKLANIDPQELSIQPLHVVLIGFIIALAGFIVLILRAVWGRGIETVNRFSDALNNQAQQIADLIELQTRRVEKLETLSFDALRGATLQASHTTNHQKP